jgi:hypothetical protein
MSLGRIEAVILGLILSFLCFRIITSVRFSEPPQESVISKIRANLKRLEPDLEFEVSENVLFDNTFTIEKSKIFICLKNKDFNTLMFVAIHELAHVKTQEFGHGQEFISNFQGLLNKAISMGMYKYTDYSRTPVEYCNMEINSTVL